MDRTVVFNEFDDWADDVERVFCDALSNGQRFQLVERLFGRCSWVLLHELFERMEAMNKRDFICHLPDWAIYRVLSYLDVKTLLTACQVSKGWKSVVIGNQRLWQNLCLRNGFLIPTEASVELMSDASLYKHLYVKNSLIMKRLSEGFREETTSVRIPCNRFSFMAMSFHNGRLMTALHDHTVATWCCDSGERLAVYVLHSQRIYQIKFNEKFIVTASADCTAACWDVTNGARLQSFVGHTKAVLSVDFSTRVDVLVTGSLDQTVKIWSLTNGTLLRTLEFKVDNRSSGSFIHTLKIWGVIDCLFSFHILAASGYSRAVVIDYTIRSTTVLEYKYVLLDNTFKKFLGFHFAESSLKVWGVRYGASSDFTDITENGYGYIDVCGRRLLTGWPVQRRIRLPLCSWVRHFGSGDNFDVFLGHRIHGGSSYFVTRNNSEAIHFAIDLPTRCSNLFSRYHISCICDTEWLNGISEESVCGRPLLAVSSSATSVELLRLKPLE